MRVKTKVIQETTLEEYMNDFIRFKMANKAAERTISDYKETFNRFLASSHNSIKCEVLMEDVLDFLSKIPDTSATVYNKSYSNLNAFFNWCVRMDYLPSNPLKKQGLTKRKDDSIIHSANIDDVKLLLEACDRSTFTGFRDYVMILVMLDTGI